MPNLQSDLSKCKKSSEITSNSRQPHNMIAKRQIKCILVVVAGSLLADPITYNSLLLEAPNPRPER
jgi:hypothetical protein